MKNGNIEVHDRSKKNFTVVPNYILRAGVKTNEIAVLLAIASFSWEGSSCTASVNTIAKAAGVKRNTVCDAIKVWEDRGQLSVERVKGIGQKITTTFDFTATSIPWDTSIQGDTTPVSRGIPLPVSRGIHKEDTVKKTKKEDQLHTPPAAASEIVPRETVVRPDADIIAVFDVFRETVNPTINYGNKTQRAAATALIKAYGVEKVVGAARAAVANFGREYWPTITNPHELREKFANLIRAAQNKSGTVSRAKYQD